MGATAVMALMTHQYVQLGGAEYAVILSFVSGCIELLAGLLNLGINLIILMRRMVHVLTEQWPLSSSTSVLISVTYRLKKKKKTGFIMDFISAPVISGFCTAAAVTVILSQFKTILGLTFRGSTFTKVLPGIFQHWRAIRVWDAALGFAFIAFLLLLKVIK
jgi:sodium-independent sulfate anion transporter 11